MFFCHRERILFLILLLFVQDNVSQDAKWRELTVHSGELVQLTPKGLKEIRLEPKTDIRWTHKHLVLSRHAKTRSRDERCFLESDGSLAFTHVQSSDAGNYSLVVFNGSGQKLLEEHFQLRVEGAEPSKGGRSALVSVLIVPLILLFIIMTYFFLRRRRSQMIVTTGPMEENLYMAMHGNRINKKIDEEDEKKEQEEESPYVPCHTGQAVSMETQITEPKTVEEENIYV